ncbi:MAG: hypothetical protein ABIX01_09035 [Chitinophagaceae bacterium]
MNIKRLLIVFTALVLIVISTTSCQKGLFGGKSEKGCGCPNKKGMVGY